RAGTAATVRPARHRRVVDSAGGVDLVGEVEDGRDLLVADRDPAAAAAAGGVEERAAAAHRLNAADPFEPAGRETDRTAGPAAAVAARAVAAVGDDVAVEPDTGVFRQQPDHAAAGAARAGVGAAAAASGQVGLAQVVVLQAGGGEIRP